ncbi:MAG TPA: D-lyxose/D-mannose family sugar isomerase [Clostridia bacterium]|nr:D-lyxose/D-mannose family sugar isomerase [Clostridia bacterium]
MKRSEINEYIARTEEWIAKRSVCLPPFAYWTPEDWAHKGHEYDEIRANMLGWDVTDYGLGDFAKTGLLLFTIRNGNLKDPRFAKAYAEKMLICEPEQLSPNHFHWYKSEDIINRGGGDLMMQLWSSNADDSLSDKPVRVRVDGRALELPAGHILKLAPGESVTLTPRVYHAFWAENGRVLAWEVSMTNDDNTDNRFYDVPQRFSVIEEDAPARRLLCNEYPRAAD